MNYGFIGLGNMATAILQGMHASGSFAQDILMGFDPDTAKAQSLSAQIGLTLCADEVELSKTADVIVLAVKPQVMEGVLHTIAPVVTPEKTVISIAAGKPLAYYEERLSPEVPVVRVMPNINARVGAAVSAVCGGTAADAGHETIAQRIFATVGKVYSLPEHQFAAFGALGGASGAFVLLYIDALASAGVKAGLPRPLSQDIACQTVLGSAKLVERETTHPIGLVDQVCSPGGTTIEGVHTLKRLGFETAIHQAIDAIIAKDARLGK